MYTEVYLSATSISYFELPLCSEHRYNRRTPHALKKIQIYICLQLPLYERIRTRFNNYGMCLNRGHPRYSNLRVAIVFLNTFYYVSLFSLRGLTTCVTGLDRPNNTLPHPATLTPHIPHRFSITKLHAELTIATLGFIMRTFGAPSLCLCYV